MFPQVLRAGEWFLRSGIQNPDGGVARYHRLDLGRNQAVSTEITGYAASALTYLYRLTNDARYLESARAAAGFLVRSWDAESGALPFEVAPAEYTYFFDCGIVVRGLLAVWSATGAAEYLECARRVGDAMLDFRAPGGEFHPILTLTGKRPVERDPLRWSRMPGCYQLKAAMAWWDLWKATGEPPYRDLYLEVCEEALRTARDFLPGHAERRKVVDRLHAYLYFLEGLLPMADEARPCAAIDEGIERVAGWLREFAPEFERSDVYAQLLRIRMYAGKAGDAAQWETERLLEFARPDGGFYFGRSAGTWEPYINPVSTAFALEALALAGGQARDRLI